MVGQVPGAGGWVGATSVSWSDLDVADAAAVVLLLLLHLYLPLWSTHWTIEPAEFGVSGPAAAAAAAAPQIQADAVGPVAD